MPSCQYNLHRSVPEQIKQKIQRKRKRYFPCTMERISQGRKYVSALNSSSVEGEAARGRYCFPLYRTRILSSRFTLDSGSMFIVTWVVGPGFSRFAGSSRQKPVFVRSLLDQLLPALLTDVSARHHSSRVFSSSEVVSSTLLCSPLHYLAGWEFTSGHSCSVSDILGILLINSTFSTSVTNTWLWTFTKQNLKNLKNKLHINIFYLFSMYWSHVILTWFKNIWRESKKH